mmetsp:Transcript_3918/g.10264  ORF Transcript_3918/g.10264 Transcript_3918/m.10264 type:complete len:86 (+) Transcript_3918:1173-1430(+)
MCPIGSVAFYLLYRFNVTCKMDESRIDFHKNKSWFDIKFITELHSHNRSKIINNNAYFIAIKRICTNSRVCELVITPILYSTDPT